MVTDMNVKSAEMQVCELVSQIQEDIKRDILLGLKGKNILILLEVFLREIFHGTKKNLQVKKEDIEDIKNGQKKLENEIIGHVKNAKQKKVRLWHII